MTLIAHLDPSVDALFVEGMETGEDTELVTIVVPRHAHAALVGARLAARRRVGPWFLLVHHGGQLLDRRLGQALGARLS